MQRSSDTIIIQIQTIDSASRGLKHRSRMTGPISTRNSYRSPRLDLVSSIPWCVGHKSSSLIQPVQFQIRILQASERA